MVARHVTAGEYSLGLDGLALLRLHRARDAADADAVVAEMKALLDRLDEPALARDSRSDPVSVLDGYQRWAAVYDLPGNPVVAYEQPAVWALLDSSLGAPVLDTACGTGRHLAHLLASGRDGIGVALSPAMLDVARANLPAADLRHGDLARLPVGDNEVAGAVCALALEHVDDLGAAYQELARVVEPGGWVIVSTVHPTIALVGWHAWFVDAAGRVDVVTHTHLLSDHVHAAGAAGLRLVGCVEPKMTSADASALAPEAASVGGPIAMDGFPVVLVQKFELG